MSNHCIAQPDHEIPNHSMPCENHIVSSCHAIPGECHTQSGKCQTIALSCPTRPCDAKRVSWLWHTKSYYTSCQTILYCEYYAKPYPVMPYHTLKWQTILVPFCAKPYRTILKTMLCHAHTMSCHSVPYYVKPYRYHVMQNYFLTCSTQLCYWQTKQNHVN